MSPTSLPTHPDERHHLAAGLRGLRLDAALSTTQLAQRLGWSQSKVSRVERAVTLAKPTEVEAWTRELGAPPALRQELIELAERQGVELLEWKRAVAPGRRRVQEEISALETAASTIWVYGMDVVPGLTQTAPYAEVMFRMGQDRAISDREVAEAVEARLARQAVLGDPAKRFRLMCTETALRRSLLPRDEMRAQLERLIEVSNMPTIELGVIPFSARERTHTYHGFSILGDPDVDDSALVLAETVTRTLTVRDRDEVREYIAHYRRLAEGAVFGEELRALLREISAQAPWS
jgi:transcriptional regulator with XRE-family HTH domain